MRIEDLYESLTPKVYHLTGGNRLYNILKTDVFMLRSVVNNKFERDMSKGKFFFMSTARSKTSAFMAERLPPDDYSGGWYFKAVLHLDGRKLNMNYGATPVDFMYASHGSLYHKRESELEDRIISDKNFIKNAKRYITMVEIMNPDTRAGYDLAEIKEVTRLLDIAGIPWLIYENERDIITNNRKNGIGRKELDAIVSKTSRKFHDPYSDEHDVLKPVLKNDERAVNHVNAIIALYTTKVLRRSLPPNIDKNKFIEQYKIWLKDIQFYGRASIEEYAIERDVALAPQIKFILSRMRKDGFNNLEEYVTHLIQMDV